MCGSESLDDQVGADSAAIRPPWRWRSMAFSSASCTSRGLPDSTSMDGALGRLRSVLMTWLTVWRDSPTFVPLTGS